MTVFLNGIFSQTVLAIQLKRFSWCHSSNMCTWKRMHTHTLKIWFIFFFQSADFKVKEKCPDHLFLSYCHMRTVINPIEFIKLSKIVCCLPFGFRFIHLQFAWEWIFSILNVLHHKNAVFRFSFLCIRWANIYIEWLWLQALHTHQLRSFLHLYSKFRSARRCHMRPFFERWINVFFCIHSNLHCLNEGGKKMHCKIKYVKNVNAKQRV